MSLRKLSTVVAAAAFVSASPLATSAQAQSVPPDFVSIVERMTPSVVAISAQRPADQQQQTIPDVLPSPFGREGPGGAPSRREARALGSGFLISEQGHVVTNNHVVEGATEIEVLLVGGARRTAELVGADPATDLAVLKIENTEGLEVADWGDSDALQPGAWTIAVGSPYGLGGTVTVGVLSARSRDIRSGPYDNFLQTDASINSGNSGGPLFNASAEVIGVNTAIFSPVGANIGIGFAVPSNTAQDVVDELIETGAVERGFIGVSLQPLTETLADALGLDTTEGAIIAQVEPNSPAEAAGLQEGDVIVGIGDTEVEDARELSRAVAERAPGAEATLSVVRDGEQIQVSLTLGERQTMAQADGSAEPGAEQQEARMGVSVIPLPEVLRRQLGIEGEQGLMVRRVEADSPASEAGLREGDVILQAGGEPIAETADLASAWEQAVEEERPVLLRVMRADASRFVAVETGQG